MAEKDFSSEAIFWGGYKEYFGKDSVICAVDT